MKLRAAPPRLAAAPARIEAGTDAEGHDLAAPWRRWRKTARWERVRQAVFRRDLYTCQCGCGTLILAPAERIADHIDDEAKLTAARFFDPDEIQTLWKPHHDGWKQRLERAARAGRPPGGAAA